MEARSAEARSLPELGACFFLEDESQQAPVSLLSLNSPGAGVTEVSGWPACHRG